MSQICRRRPHCDTSTLSWCIHTNEGFRGSGFFFTQAFVLRHTSIWSARGLNSASHVLGFLGLEIWGIMGFSDCTEKKDSVGSRNPKMAWSTHSKIKEYYLLCREWRQENHHCQRSHTIVQGTLAAWATLRFHYILLRVNRSIVNISWNSIKS